MWHQMTWLRPVKSKLATPRHLSIQHTWAIKAWKKRLAWAMTTKLDPVRRVAKTIKEHLWGLGLYRAGTMR
jgi:hypothetical protein